MADHVLLVAEARITTVQLLERILGHLEHNSTLRFTSRLLHELEPEDFAEGVYPLIVRTCNPEAARLVRALRRSGTKFGFYLDDNFWLLDPSTELGRHYAARPTRRRLDSIVRNSSPVIVSTALLRDWIALRAHHVMQLDSFFDFSLVPSALSSRPKRDEVRVGFAASAHRGDDLVEVMPQILSVLDEYPKLFLEVIGADVEALGAHPRIRVFPYLSSYEVYLKFQLDRAWDIGLAPLGALGSNLYKTDNKYREYAALGIAGIYQNAPPYAAVRHGDSGLLAGGELGWGDALRRFLSEPGLIDHVRQAAHTDARARLSLDVIAPQWGAFLAEAPAIGADNRAERLRQSIRRPQSVLARRLLRVRLLWAHGLTQLAEHGFWPTLARTVRFVARGVARGTPKDPR